MVSAGTATEPAVASRRRPRVLILSFEDISVDPRVMKQVRLLAPQYEVTTCGPGPQPHPDVVHVELDAETVRPRGRVGHLLDDIAREREWFSWTYRHGELVQQTAERLEGRSFDAAIANDAGTVGVANRIVGARRVHADLHEFFPGLPVADNASGRRQVRYWKWLTRVHAAKARSSTTVGWEIAKRYQEFGLNPGVVTNAPPYRELDVAPTSRPIRIVHSGNPFRERGLAEIMRAVAAVPAEMTLDLYLTHNGTADRAYLVDLAESLGQRVSIHEPVSQAVLVETLHQYDVGIHVLPPTSENNALALPNKFFDFVQARLAVVVGPSAEMARLVRERGLGVVTGSFEESAIVDALDSLTVEQVDAFKSASDAAAVELAAEAQVAVWDEAIRSIVESEPDDRPRRRSVRRRVAAR